MTNECPSEVFYAVNIICSKKFAFRQQLSYRGQYFNWYNKIGIFKLVQHNMYVHDEILLFLSQIFLTSDVIYKRCEQMRLNN